MNRDRLAGICMQLKGRVRENWGRLNLDPVSAAAGSRDRLIGRIQERRGIVKEATERDLNEFLARHRNWWDLSS